MSDIILLASYGATNFVGYEGKVFAVPQSLGPCNDSTWSHPSVCCFNNLDEARTSFQDVSPSSASGGIKTFWVEKLPQVEWVYESRADGPCPVHGAEHRETSQPLMCPDGKSPDNAFDQLSPKKCACGFEFNWRHHHGSGSSFWKRLDTGETIRSPLPPAALYVTDKLRDQDGWEYAGADGLNIVCVLPNGHHWWIDSRASNCTMKNDVTHRCWVRHGTVGGIIHVDKNGNTCAAGAGSIQSGNWHGHLHNGFLV